MTMYKFKLPVVVNLVMRKQSGREKRWMGRERETERRTNTWKH